MKRHLTKRHLTKCRDTGSHVSEFLLIRPPISLGIYGFGFAN